jgi:hypothetical protein
MWDCIKECFSTIFPAIGIYTLCVLVGAFIAALIAAGATGGVGGVVILGAAKVALAWAGFAFTTSSLGALVGCLGGCRIVV